MTFTTKNKRAAAAGLTFVALVCGIAACIHPSIYTLTLDVDLEYDDDAAGATTTLDHDMLFGVWQTNGWAVGKSNDDYYAVKCDLPHAEPEGHTPDKTDCDTAMNAKCKTQQAFSVLGVLASAAVVAAWGLSDRFVLFDWTKTLRTAVAGFAAVSYVIVFAIAAQLFNDDSSDDADCGAGLKKVIDDTDGVDGGFGAAFWLLVVGFGLSVVATLLHLLEGTDGFGLLRVEM